MQFCLHTYIYTNALKQKNCKVRVKRETGNNSMYDPFKDNNVQLTTLLEIQENPEFHI